ncbi:MAG: hypothetical protein ACJAWV_003294 [Flammeovirgaceae bacterium]|jgi:hypothetical protein
MDKLKQSILANGFIAPFYVWLTDGEEKPEGVKLKTKSKIKLEISSDWANIVWFVEIAMIRKLLHYL